MEKEKCECCTKCGASNGKGGAIGGGIYGMAFIGALIYFLQHATSFGMGVLGVIKAIGWPAVLVHKALELLAA